ncbi:V/A-type H+-transporting ATPase subunit I [Anaerobacterium chartisolvens]|uniref:V/A-type H+-transporting ATPase subunit I n=1 Tax=Anaerobacterium chartisolvens TaxID=1297424 RepID=A0A369BA95_9FIRM|nr:V-type ATP synthase subunit I [Anaerobacterium chartisolvens]RCX17486.1 V/A-type H+-transporting ATPase subunit I [Anaerobacterium chartisolvens]
MAVVEMNKISLIGLNKDKDNIIHSLMKMGVCEVIGAHDKLSSEKWEGLVAADGDMEGVGSLDADIERIGLVLDSIEKYHVRKRGMFEFKRCVARTELDEVLNRRGKLEELVDSVMIYNERLSALKAEKNRKVSLIASLEPWQSLQIPLEITSTRTCKISIGVIPFSHSSDAFAGDLEGQAEAAHVELLNSDREQSYFLVIYHNKAQEAVMKVWKNYGFSKVVFKDLKGTAQDNIKEAAAVIQSIDKEYGEVEAAICALESERPQLEVLYDYLVLQRDKKKALGKLVKTEKTFMLEGWIPEEMGEQIKAGLEKRWDCLINIAKPEEGEEFPILLSNKGVGSAVESVTGMYGLPHYKEIDPNSIMGPFFVLFFGLMLSDAGYGIVMMLAAAFMIWKLKEGDGKKKFFKLMLYCGASTMLWGALFGGWFGIEAFSRHPIWFSPVEDPEELLRWSLLFGVIHIYTGIGVRAVNLIRSKKYADIIFDVVIWYIFFTGFILFVLPYTPKVNAQEVAGLVEAGKYLLAAGGVLLILTQGRKQKNIFMKIVSGFSSLYDLIGFMSDVLSYSRLLALGLATSVIASIVNEMGAMGGLDSVFKVAGFVVILLVGHTFNFAINALGAYVHASRLQYIEFFGKFYKGGGTSFEPLRVDTKYVELKD